MEFENKNINNNVTFEEFRVQSIELNGIMSEDAILGIEIEDRIVDDNNGKLEVNLELIITDKKSNFCLKLALIGYFCIEDKYSELFKPNLLAIMFPYMRSAVSYLTSIDGNHPIILPPINFNEYCKQRKIKKDKK